ncbi:hypothetical protein [Streptomyces sp. NPDC057509]|uniref:hypothetical protein n=1 Tax=Streptomyces sp. NPDC057509 TaxID=3346152 RepID=UPI0036CCC1DD
MGDDENSRARAKIGSVEKAHDDAVRERNAAVGNVERLSEAVKDARADAEYFQAWAEGNGRRLNEVLAQASTYRRQRDRFRLAWLSARRRAADEANFGMEALELRDAEIARLKAELADLRESTHATSELEYMGSDEEGGVYRLWES